MDGTHTCTLYSAQCIVHTREGKSRNKDKRHESGFETVATVRKAEIFQAKHKLLLSGFSFRLNRNRENIFRRAPKKIETETVSGQLLA